MPPVKPKLIKVDFIGTRSGTIYFIGQPVYNAEKKTIEVQGLDYDLQTKSLFLKTAKWLFNKREFEDNHYRHTPAPTTVGALVQSLH